MINYYQLPVMLAYFFLIYVYSSVYYIFATRNLGTPFNDAIEKYPKLKELKQKSVNKRKMIFYKGIILSLIVLILFPPFDIYKKI